MQSLKTHPILIQTFKDMAQAGSNKELIDILLSADNYSWELDDTVVKFIPSGQFTEWEMDLQLPSELFNKELYINDRWSNDPTLVRSAGLKAINELEHPLDEWDGYEIAQVFIDNKKLIEVIRY